MKKGTCLNSEVSYVIAKLGHFDTLTIGDAGLPIPDGVQRIDLAVKMGLPGFRDVLETVLSEMKIQKATIAAEMVEINPELYEYMKARIAQEGAELVLVPHEELKRQSASSKAVVRTGECKAYANVILESNVTF
ncbi:MAG: D-ribose pyranase [Clostridiales bacterium]|nr:D-ribose pyranase [Clostridiales bacterium]